MFDKVKQGVDGLKNKLAEELDEHGEKIGANLDKAADFVDDKTGGKFSGQIDKAVDAVKDAADRLDGTDDDDLGASHSAATVPPTAPPASPTSTPPATSPASPPL